MQTPRHMPGGQRRHVGVVLAAICLATAGCMGSWAIRGTRLHYNESFSHTSSQEMLLNLVRMRYGETPTFLDLPTINNVTEATVDGRGAQPEGSPLQGVFGGNFRLRDEPTLSYQPRSGDNLAESLVKPPKAEVLLDIPPGNDTRTFLMTFVDSINGIRNSPTATSPASRTLLPNDDYRDMVDLFMGLQNRGAVKLRVAKRDDEVHGPVPDKQVLGYDAVAAAKEGFVYQSSDDDVRLMQRTRLMAMAIKPEEVDAPELVELAGLLRLHPGLDTYVVKSQEDAEIDLNDELSANTPPPEMTDTIAIDVRSGYQAMAFLSKGVDVPESHVRRCLVHSFKGPDGRHFDARQLTGGLFRVCVQRHRPLRSDLAVHYRGYWFYIAEDDVRSRATLSFLKFVIDLNSQAGSVGPVLTLPLR